MKKRPSVYTVIGAVLLLLCILCVIYLLTDSFGRHDITPPAGLDSTQVQTQMTVETESTDSGTEPSESAVAPSVPANPENSGVDLGELRKSNPDIRAWLYMPALSLSEPVMGHDKNNSYYHRRDPNGKYSLAGSIYMENYNSFDLSDPVTVIYGHNMEKEMFAKLQENYSNEVFFRENNSFTVYTESGEYEYRIFAAVPYGDAHILYYNDFFSFPVLEKFIGEIYETRSLTAVFDREITVEEGDKVIILSTCYDGNNRKRYLVLGVCKQ